MGRTIPVRLILVAAVIFFVGSLGMATAQNVWWLIALVVAQLFDTIGPTLTF